MDNNLQTLRTELELLAFRSSDLDLPLSNSNNSLLLIHIPSVLSLPVFPSCAVHFHVLWHSPLYHD
jgi:hypothetical protein